MERLSLHTADWLVIAVYLVFAMAVGLAVRKTAGTDRESYFLAGRSLPWWWAGLSIAATTFAADTPLAVTGIVADRGLSGNWMWLSWIGVHAGVVVYFAARWSRSGVITDAELVTLRYDGRSASVLRTVRSLLFGLVYNAIILGWVLRAMAKIASPFVQWDLWLPWLGAWATGSSADTLTIIALLLIVGFYSSLGGVRGVIVTDLLQLGVALLGSAWLATAAWTRAGGRDTITAELTRLYGRHHDYLDLFPTTETGWVKGLGIGVFTFGVYLIVQSYTNVPADGGGYMMQRLNATKNPREARRASMLFVAVHYLARCLPWFIVAVCALVLIPIGEEATALGGAAAAVAGDRELAYPVLMIELLPPVVLGLMITSLLAAFMSTVDTHINWGASYIVNDIYCVLRPDSTDQEQLRVARGAVVGFAVLAVLVSLQIDTIEEAWKWVAALGAALGIPTVLRWIWWRVNAEGELAAMTVGLVVAAALTFFTDVPYEVRLILISAASLAGMIVGIVVWPSSASGAVLQFVKKVKPAGLWPDRPAQQGYKEIGSIAVRWVLVIAGVVLILFALHRAVFLGAYLHAALGAALGSVLCWRGANVPDSVSR